MPTPPCPSIPANMDEQSSSSETIVVCARLVFAGDDALRAVCKVGLLMVTMHLALCTLRDLEVAEAASQEHLRHCRRGRHALWRPPMGKKRPESVTRHFLLMSVRFFFSPHVLGGCLRLNRDVMMTSASDHSHVVRASCVLRDRSVSRKRKQPSFFLSFHSCKHWRRRRASTLPLKTAVVWAKLMLLVTKLLASSSLRLSSPRCQASWSAWTRKTATAGTRADFSTRSLGLSYRCCSGPHCVFFSLSTSQAHPLLLHQS